MPPATPLPQGALCRLVSAGQPAILPGYIPSQRRSPDPLETAQKSVVWLGACPALPVVAQLAKTRAPSAPHAVRQPDRPVAAANAVALMALFQQPDTVRRWIPHAKSGALPAALRATFFRQAALMRHVLP